MTDVADRYRTNAAAFIDKVRAVPDDGWRAATPCEEWTVTDLVQHVVDSQGMFLGFIGEEAPELPSASDDPVRAVTGVTTAIQAAVDDPELAAREHEGQLGTLTFAEMIDRFLATDLTVHGWDLARATGQAEEIRPEEVAKVQAIAEGFGDAMRSRQAFGPAVDPPEGADDQARLLAFLGRHP